MVLPARCRQHVQIRWQNIASRSFGSNQVLLGGMMPPASAIGHQVLDARREHRERAGVFAAVHQLFQFRRAANAADEIDVACSCAGRQCRKPARARVFASSVTSSESTELRGALSFMRRPSVCHLPANKGRFRACTTAGLCRSVQWRKRLPIISNNCSGVQSFKSFSTRL